jgi:hypothetical protein
VNRKIEDKILSIKSKGKKEKHSFRARKPDFKNKNYLSSLTGNCARHFLDVLHIALIVTYIMTYLSQPVMIWSGHTSIFFYIELL